MYLDINIYKTLTNVYFKHFLYLLISWSNKTATNVFPFVIYFNSFDSAFLNLKLLHIKANRHQLLTEHKKDLVILFLENNIKWVWRTSHDYYSNVKSILEFCWLLDLRVLNNFEIETRVQKVSNQNFESFGVVWIRQHVLQISNKHVAIKNFIVKLSYIMNNKQIFTNFHGSSKKMWFILTLIFFVSIETAIVNKQLAVCNLKGKLICSDACHFVWYIYSVNFRRRATFSSRLLSWLKV